MITTDTLDSCFESIEAVINSKRIIIEDEFSDELYHVKYSFEGHPCSFLVLIPKSFPNTKPIIALDFKVRAVGDLPHLMRTGAICYADNEGLLLDESNPTGVIREALYKAAKTIFQSVTGQSKDDYVREFDYYWRLQRNVIYANSICGRIAKPVIIWAVTLGNGKLFFGKDKDDLRNYFSKVRAKWLEDSWEEFLYVPLISHYGISFDSPWTIATIRSVIFGNIGFKDRIKQHLRSNKHLPIYLAMPAHNNSQIHFAVRFDKSPNRKHPLLETKMNIGITAVAIDRMDKEYLLKRGGGATNIISKNVVIIGVGAVGGMIALELAKAGIANLTLVDHDLLEAENIHRHVLGLNDGVGKNKAAALKARIEKSIPHCEVLAVPKRYEDLDVSDIDYSQVDLIINCTGVENIGFIINKKLWPEKAVIHAWVEPMGIGGHALLSLGSGTSGCFKCLFGYDSEEGLYNKSSFVRPGQRFSKSMFGCAGMFTPFSSLDTLKTSVLALEMALSFLNGDKKNSAQQPQLLSWKGSDSQLVAEGFRVSSRFENMSEEELFQSRSSFINMDCEVCSKKIN